MRESKRIRKHAWPLSLRVALVAILTFVTFFADLPIPPAVAKSDHPNGNNGLHKGWDSPQPRVELSAEDRLPVQADVPVPDSLELELIPPLNVQAGQSPKQVVAGLTPVPDAGGANFDAFAGPDGTVHAQLVYPRVVNRETPDGSWVPITPNLSAEGAGWQGTFAAGSLHLPPQLGPGSGARINLTSGGSLSIAPTGGLGASVTASGVSATYNHALIGADVSYTMRDFGVTEKTTIANKQTLPTLSWNLGATGLSLRRETTGEVSILSGTTIIGKIAPASITDAGGNPAPITSSYSLSGSTLSLVADLSKAKFPATVAVPIDFGTGFNADTYVDESAPDSSFESASEMKVGPGKSAFVHFDLTGIASPDTTISDAVLGLQASSGNGKLEVHANASSWPAPGQFKWNTQPQVAPEVLGTSTAGSDGAYQVELTDHYNDVVQAGGADLGVRISPQGPGNQTTLAASETGAQNVTLLLVSSALPDPPRLLYPRDGEVLESPSPVLRLDSIPKDSDGDDVYLNYQVQNDNKTFAADPVWQSGWTDSRTVTIPSGMLIDGQKYRWRVQSWDQKTPVNNDNYPVSGTRTFAQLLRHLGDDERYGMWQKPIGNDMAIKVNQGNGNLYLSVPLDELITPTDTISLGMNYNSQSRDGNGLGRGWDIYAGPGSSYRDLPVELQEIDHTEKDAGVKVIFQDGSVQFFGHVDGNVYSGPGTLIETQHQGYMLTTTEGGHYTFQEGGQHRALVQARPAYTSTKAINGIGTTFDYAFQEVAGQNRITKLTDPLNRKIHFCWSAAQSTPCGTYFEPGSTLTIRVWDERSFVITQPGPLAGAMTVEDPTGAVRTFTSSSTADSLSTDTRVNQKTVITKIQDGAQTADSTMGSWGISYIRTPIKDAAVTDFQRVSRVTPPPVTVTPTTIIDEQQYNGQGYWSFFYHGLGAGNFQGTTADYTDVFDPRYDVRDSSDGHTSTRYKTTTYFNTAGFPQVIQGPQDRQGVWPLKTYVFDTENQLLCERTAAANAINEIRAGKNECEGNPYSKTYVYEQKTGRMKSTLDPRPVKPADFSESNPNHRRVETTYQYDQGMDGLWATYYSNTSLSGLPAGEELSGTLHEDFDDPPKGVDNNMTWSAQYSGYLKVDHTDTYGFRIFSQDGASLSVGGKTIADCFNGQNRGAGKSGFSNCGDNQNGPDVSKILGNGDKHPIAIQLQNQQGDGLLRVQWREKTGPDSWSNWDTIAATDLSPNRGLLTATTIGGYVGENNMQERTRTTYDYPRASLMARNLPGSETAHDLVGANPAPNQTTTYHYDDFGRLTRKILPPSGTDAGSGGAEDRAFKYEYHDEMVGAPTDANSSGKSCLATVTDPTGAVSTSVCDAAGDVLESTQVIRAVAAPSVAQVTATEYALATSSGPQGITTGPDGNLWFTEQRANKIGMITPQGVVTEFPIPTPNSGPVEITTGPDGNLWFAESAANKIGRITPQGVIAEFPLTGGADFGDPQAITLVEGDNALWFTVNGSTLVGGVCCRSSKIGRITPAGVITAFNVPQFTGMMTDIVEGPDERVWFTEYATDGSQGAIGRINPTNQNVTLFPIPGSNPDGAGLSGIATGPLGDGHLWFTELFNDKVTKITTDGVMTRYDMPEGSSPYKITPFQDSLWVTQQGAGFTDKVAQLELTGTVTERDPGGAGTPTDLIEGPDGQLWFTNFNAGQVGALVAPPPVQPRQDRTTRSCFDGVGRTTLVDQPGAGATLNAYDLAGRLVAVTTVIEATQAPLIECSQATIPAAQVTPPFLGGATLASRVSAHATSLFPGATLATTLNTYDGRGQLVRNDFPKPDAAAAAPFETYRYDNGGNQTERTDANLAIWSSAFDATGRPIGTRSPEGRNTTMTYVLENATGQFVNQTVATDPGNVVTTSTMDVLGRTVKTHSGTAAMLSTEMEYDINGNLLKTTKHAPGGDIVTSSKYNGFNQVTQSTAPFRDSGVLKQANTNLFYDSAGRLSSVLGPDAAGVAGVPGALNAHQVDYSYDAAGRVTKVSIPQIKMAPGGIKTAETRVTYDDAGEQVGVATNMNEDQTQIRSWSYDENGRTSSATVYGARVFGNDASNQTTFMSYNAAGWLTRTTLPNGYVLFEDYDNLGRVTNHSYLGNGYEIGRRRRRRNARRPCRDQCDITNTYDAVGNLLTTNREFYTTTMVYNKDNQIESVDSGDQGLSTYSYSEGAGSTGRLDSMSTPAGTTRYGYNANGMLSSVTDPFMNPNPTAPQKIVGYTYDCAGRIIYRSANAPSDCQAEPSVVPTSSDAGGMLWSRIFEPGTGRVQTQTIKSNNVQVAKFEQTYDSMGNVKTRRELVSNPGSSTGGATEGSGLWTYTYDPANRLKTAVEQPQNASGGNSGSSRQTDYTYDLAGNRTTVKEGVGPLRTMRYDSAGLPIEETPNNGAGATSYQFDAGGHLVKVDAPDTAPTPQNPSTSAKDRCYFYDGFSNLRAANLTSASGCARDTGDIIYSYDPFDRVVERNASTPVATDTLDFTYQGISEDLAQQTDSATGTTSYVTTPAGPLAQQKGTATSFFMKDLHGDVVGLTSGNTQTMGQLYSPYGEPTPKSGSGSTDLGFQGDYTDSKTGLVDMGARLYDPNLARFATQDTVFGDLMNPTSLNQFAYGNGNPLTMIDPTGMSAQCAGYTACTQAEYNAQKAAIDQWWAARHAYESRVDAWASQMALYDNFYQTVPQSRYESKAAYMAARDRLYPGAKPEWQGGPRPPVPSCACWAGEHADLDERNDGKVTPDVVWVCGWVPGVMERARDCPDYDPRDPRTMPKPFDASLAGDLRWEQDKHASPVAVTLENYSNGLKSYCKDTFIKGSTYFSAARPAVFANYKGVHGVGLLGAGVKGTAIATGGSLEMSAIVASGARGAAPALGGVLTAGAIGFGTTNHLQCWLSGNGEY